MKMAELRALQTIADARYRHEHAAVAPLLNEEAQIRARLARLDTQVAEARHRPEQTELMRPFGADVVWMAWADQARRKLNMQLAHVLARKELAMDRVRRAFGKSMVADALVERHTDHRPRS
ncbi:MAG: hypothetical protein NXH82_02840 [Rhodobacteraceae bacterium]|nr:hypothetical protein [Paracoccaceae bacterium]